MLSLSTSWPYYQIANNLESLPSTSVPEITLFSPYGLNMLLVMYGSSSQEHLERPVWMEIDVCKKTYVVTHLMGCFIVIGV